MKNNLMPLLFSLQIKPNPHKTQKQNKWKNKTKHTLPSRYSLSALSSLVSSVTEDTCASPSPVSLTPPPWEQLSMANPLVSPQSSSDLWRILLEETFACSLYLSRVHWLLSSKRLYSQFFFSYFLMLFTGSASCSSNAGVGWGFILGSPFFSAYHSASMGSLLQ